MRKCGEPQPPCGFEGIKIVWLAGPAGAPSPSRSLPLKVGDGRRGLRILESGEAKCKAAAQILKCDSDLSAGGTSRRWGGNLFELAVLSDSPSPPPPCLPLLTSLLPHCLRSTYISPTR